MYGNTGKYKHKWNKILSTGGSTYLIYMYWFIFFSIFTMILLFDNHVDNVSNKLKSPDPFSWKFWKIWYRILENFSCR